MEKSVTKIVATPGLQPRGGFIDPRDMSKEPLTNDLKGGVKDMLDVTTDMGNFTAQSLGLVFDYLLRVEIAMMSGESVKNAVIEAFKVSILGASMVNKLDSIKKPIAKIIVLYDSEDFGDDKKLLEIAQNASELVVYDAVFRAGYYNPDYKPPKLNRHDSNTLSIMLGSTLEYFATKNDRVTSLGFGFKATGAKNVAPSDGDILTETSLIDLKCSIKEPTSKHTLQLLMYYILGMHEYKSTFSKLKYLKILNPRLNMVYSYDVAKVDKETLKHIEKDIMGYKKSVF